MKILYVRPNKYEAPVVQEALSGHEVIFSDSLETVDSQILQTIEVLSVFVDTQVKSEMLQQCLALRCIATRSVGFDHIDTKYAAINNICVLRVPHYGSQTVAEFAFSLMFALSRHAYVAYTDLIADTSVDTLEPYEGFDLGGKTLGVVGTGKIGERVCAIAKSFGMEVIAFDQFPRSSVTSLGVTYVDLETLMKQSDIVTLHVPSLPETYHLITAQLLSQMKPTAYLINTARGEVIDTVALVTALQEKKIAGAGLDVLEGEHMLAKEESLTDEQKSDTTQMELLSLNHTLIAMPNVIVTPHIAFNTREAKQEITNTTIANILSYIHGEPTNKIPV